MLGVGCVWEVRACGGRVRDMWGVRVHVGGKGRVGDGKQYVKIT